MKNKKRYIIATIAIITVLYCSYALYIKYDAKHLRIVLNLPNGNSQYSVHLQDEGILRETHSYYHMSGGYEYGCTYEGIKEGNVDMKVQYTLNTEVYQAMYHVEVDQQLHISCDKEPFKKIK